MISTRTRTRTHKSGTRPSPDGHDIVKPRSYTMTAATLLGIEEPARRKALYASVMSVQETVLCSILALPTPTDQDKVLLREDGHLDEDL